MSSIPGSELLKLLEFLSDNADGNVFCPKEVTLGGPLVSVWELVARKPKPLIFN